MIEIGKEMHWHRREGNYGFLAVYRVKVERVGKRVTVRVKKKNGDIRLVSVKPENLKPIIDVTK